VGFLNDGLQFTGIQGQFRASLESPNSVLGATKYCVFKPIPISRETVEAAVRQRMERMRTTQIDLLQAILLLSLCE
jgi:aryl-alcohol dehydrogenase-like predicted oxidoreductase